MSHPGWQGSLGLPTPVHPAESLCCGAAPEDQLWACCTSDRRTAPPTTWQDTCVCRNTGDTHKHCWCFSNWFPKSSKYSTCEHRRTVTGSISEHVTISWIDKCGTHHFRTNPRHLVCHGDLPDYQLALLSYWNVEWWIMNGLHESHPRMMTHPTTVVLEELSLICDFVTISSRTSST